MRRELGAQPASHGSPRCQRRPPRLVRSRQLPHARADRKQAPSNSRLTAPGPARSRARICLYRPTQFGPRAQFRRSVRTGGSAPIPGTPAVLGHAPSVCALFPFPQCVRARVCPGAGGAAVCPARLCCPLSVCSVLGLSCPVASCRVLFSGSGVRSFVSLLGLVVGFFILGDPVYVTGSN